MKIASQSDIFNRQQFDNAFFKLLDYGKERK